MVIVLLTALLVYAAIVGSLFVMQRRLLYVPFGGVPDSLAADVPEMAPVTLRTADGLSLLAWWAPPPTLEAPVFAFFHGNAGNLALRGEKLRPFLDAGVGILLLAYRGFSGNPGTPTEQGLYEDARAALGFLAAADIASSRIVLYGESLGTGVAVQMATEQPVRAVVLEAPFSAVTDVAAARYWYVPVRLLLKDRYDSAAKIGGIAAPILIFAGGRDTIIPARFARRLFDAAREPKELRFIPEATHLDFYRHGAAPIVLDFLDRHPPRSALDAQDRAFRLVSRLAKRTASSAARTRAFALSMLS